MKWLIYQKEIIHIQTEIVRIMDKFAEHREKLERLIELRKMQYKYNREEMMRFLGKVSLCCQMRHLR
ncbi:MAG: hypothetical protein J6Y37_12835 [Paludibacteraceae bacterium]|nr:hypothetical protein [Paludibacteraceae bacterium]